MITATLKVIKNKEKANISVSQTTDKNTGEFRSWNITGSLVELEGYKTREGEDYSRALVESAVPTTAIIYDYDLGEAIYERCAEIFEERTEAGDINPAVDLRIELKSVRPKSGNGEYGPNILLTNIKKVFVDKETQMQDNKESIEDFLKAAAAVNTDAQLRNRPVQRGHQVQSAREGVTNLVKKLKRTYL